MSQSYNEVEALVRRAARGVRQSWGMADESARATRWLEERSLPGAKFMVLLLELYDTNMPAKPVVDQDNWLADPETVLCPVVTGTALSDFSMLLLQHSRITCSEIACPLLLLPFAAQASLSTERCLSVHWNTKYYLLEGNRLASNTDSNESDYSLQTPDPDSARVIVEVSPVNFDDQLIAQPSFYESFRLDRASIDQESWAKLTSLAHRTYAPASEESRRLGAGAGNSDND